MFNIGPGEIFLLVCLGVISAASIGASGDPTVLLHPGGSLTRAGLPTRPLGNDS